MNPELRQILLLSNHQLSSAKKANVISKLLVVNKSFNYNFMTKIKIMLLKVIYNNTSLYNHLRNYYYGHSTETYNIFLEIVNKITMYEDCGLIQDFSYSIARTRLNT